MADLKLNTTNGSVTLKPEEGSGNVDVTIPRAGIGKILQVQKVDVGGYAISSANTANNRDLKTVVSGLSLNITTLANNSKILLICSASLTNATGSHTYFDIKRNGSWVPIPYGADSLWADHATGNVTTGVNVTYLDSPGAGAGASISYTFYTGDWGGGVVSLNKYPSNTNADGFTQFIAMEIAN